MSERIYKKREVRELLQITKYRYLQLIEEGILAAPIKLSANSHAVHTASQLQSAEWKLAQMSRPQPAEQKPAGYKPIRISDKLFREIQQSSCRR